ncbi:MAG: hypothetical protein A3G32_08310 [Deltaproteobacteria bacterium RIFCSPLOWO2_12_FULL_40_28]|nr:MAG: hypothetical protein A3C45_01010 [Deltaproteobacteria bacterium RIFCSPHIGHO2_02_FULL_40_28]OGQ20912.1 MAG: hypothetical protein A3E27_03675 [Deltaproteobacteria bacterium RIFCSPHIGHO2_12_FULL_40_32]OGQ39313.1 MAG: hypothetical protein A3I69_05035 [Deltaproteobacteria bacterium RIFCSPLOWO2_02_FULL_40_36]OGQ54594.1 MAG: hypothetical protein A3G32_08310 [Deltaproteobacteria bacterium RIFCSPLOWO2_12_FULL_40_28]
MKGILFFLFFIFPLSSMAQERKAYTAYEEENYFQASEYYKLKVNKKNSPENHYNLGVSLYQEGLYTEANDHFLEALNSRKKETRQQALYNLGNSAYRNNQLTQAIDYYEKALSLNPSDQWAIDNLEYVKNKLQEKEQEKPKNQQEKDQEKQKEEEQKNQQQQQQQQEEKNGEEKKQENENQKEQNPEKKPEPQSSSEALKTFQNLDDNPKKAIQDMILRDNQGLSERIEKDW